MSARGADAALLVAVRGSHRLAPDSGPVAPMACPVELPAGAIFNGGKADRDGALWIGSSDAGEGHPLGRLWRVARGAACEVARGFVVWNGPAFSPDGDVACFADPCGCRILCLPIRATGRPSGPRVFAGLPDGRGLPAGMTVNSTGDLLVEHWDGARITRWSPDGRLPGETALPPRNVTPPAFGGTDLRTALVTTSGLFPGKCDDATLPWNGDLLSFRAEVPGLAEPLLAPDCNG